MWNLSSIPFRSHLVHFLSCLSLELCPTICLFNLCKGFKLANTTRCWTLFNSSRCADHSKTVFNYLNKWVCRFYLGFIHLEIICYWIIELLVLSGFYSSGNNLLLDYWTVGSIHWFKNEEKWTIGSETSGL